MKRHKIQNGNILKGVLIIFASALILYGCSDNGVSPNSSSLSLSFSSNKSMNKVQSGPLVITSAKILINDLMIEKSEVNAEAGDSLNILHGVMGGGQADAGVSEDEDLRMDPLVVDLNVNGSLNTVAVNSVPQGTYYAVKFKIHKPQPYEAIPDSEFRDSNNNRYSVVVKGTYNGTPFVFKSDITAEQKIMLNPPVTVTGNNPVNVTITVNPYDWFASNGSYMDPSDNSNQAEINSQIRTSFRKGFEDDDMSGAPDD